MEPPPEGRQHDGPPGADRRTQLLQVTMMVAETGLDGALKMPYLQEPNGAPGGGRTLVFHKR